jgi:hypothetical protein
LPAATSPVIGTKCPTISGGDCGAKMEKNLPSFLSYKKSRAISSCYEAFSDEPKMEKNLPYF